MIAWLGLAGLVSIGSLMVFVGWAQLFLQRCTRCTRWFTRWSGSKSPSFRCDRCLIVEELTR